MQEQAGKEGISFAKAMRMLAGGPTAEADSLPDEPLGEWSRVVAGDWLASRLNDLRSPGLRERLGDNAGLEAELTAGPRQRSCPGFSWARA